VTTEDRVILDRIRRGVVLTPERVLFQLQSNFAPELTHRVAMIKLATGSLDKGSALGAIIDAVAGAAIDVFIKGTVRPTSYRLTEFAGAPSFSYVSVPKQIFATTTPGTDPFPLTANPMYVLAGSSFKQDNPRRRRVGSSRYNPMGDIQSPLER
jgi:hypothetical protein